MKKKRTELEDLIHVSEMKQVERIVDNIFTGIDSALEKIGKAVDPSYSTKVNAVISSMIVGELSARLYLSVPDRYTEDVRKFQLHHCNKVIAIMENFEEDEEEDKEEDGDYDSLMKELGNHLVKVIKEMTEVKE